jgi:replicative DNA helicase
VAKNRDGETGIVELLFDGAKTTFKNPVRNLSDKWRSFNNG